MNILIIGGGGREHALAWRIAREPNAKVFASPGNPGIAACATCIPPSAPTPEGYLEIARSVGAHLTVAGPEAPLVAGTADAFLADGRLFVGPTQAAARLEASKQFAKQVMVAAGIPTAEYYAASSVDEARQALARFSYPLVVKADGLAAGKGVIVAHDEHEAGAALDSLSATLGPRILIEEFLRGEEASFIVLSDGKTAIPLEATQDHKTIYDNDSGPNTGGMGAYCDGRILTPDQTKHVLDTVIQPTIDYMRSRGTPFTGFLYAGLMMTDSGPKVLEFNVRLGDPETQTILHRVRSGFLEALTATASGALAGPILDWHNDPSVCVVMAAAGYPDSPRTGALISGLDAAEATGATVFHAGTRGSDRGIETSGGRVLGVTASGKDLSHAIQNTYAAIQHIKFDGMQYRKDIGAKGLKRW
jgi:phosphoribosylamine---glycine ligase